MIPSKTQVTKAGKRLLSSKTNEERNYALEVINEWRSNHLYPLNIMKNYLIKILNRNELDVVLISQRLKRLTSIEYKLDLNKNMALGGMQDIGGFRVVLTDAKELMLLKGLINANEETKRYTLEYEDNYVDLPKPSGYRSIHFVYTFHSKAEKYNGLKIELQIRTRLQHSWATAVETAGIFTKTSLKSSKGSDEWLDFFRIVSSLFAIKERLPVLDAHKHLSMEELMIECYTNTQKLKVIGILKALRISAHHIEVDKIDGDYFILNINFKEQTVNIQGFKRRYFNTATSEYLKLEKTIKEGENAVVLVSASSFKSLKKAYPSYFLDTSEFIAALERINSNCKRLKLI